MEDSGPQGRLGKLIAWLEADLADGKAQSGGSLKSQEWLNEIRRERGKLPPKPDKDEVKADPAASIPKRLLWVQHAFCALSRARQQFENGPQPVTLTEILSYCELVGFYDVEQRSDLVYFISEMDLVWLRHTYAKLAADREKMQKEAERKAASKQRRR